MLTVMFGNDTARVESCVLCATLAVVEKDHFEPGRSVSEIDCAAFCVFGKRAAVVAVEVIAGIAGGSEVYRSGEVQIGVGFGILGVRPKNLEVGRLRVVGSSFVAEYGFDVTEVERAGEFVAFYISRAGFQPP